MSVRPYRVNPDATVAVLHEEMGHGGAAPPSALRFGRNEDGSPAIGTLEVTCPVCGGLSVHPASGGAAPAPIQRLFLRLWLARAQALGIPPAERTIAARKARLRALVERMDGPARWRLEAAADDPDDLGAA